MCVCTVCACVCLSLSLSVVVCVCSGLRYEALSPRGVAFRNTAPPQNFTAPSQHVDHTPPHHIPAYARAQAAAHSSSPLAVPPAQHLGAGITVGGGWYAGREEQNREGGGGGHTLIRECVDVQPALSCVLSSASCSSEFLSCSDVEEEGVVSQTRVGTVVGRYSAAHRAAHASVESESQDENLTADEDGEDAEELDDDEEVTAARGEGHEEERFDDHEQEEGEGVGWKGVQEDEEQKCDGVMSSTDYWEHGSNLMPCLPPPMPSSLLAVHERVGMVHSLQQPQQHHLQQHGGKKMGQNTGRRESLPSSGLYD